MPTLDLEIRLTAPAENALPGAIAAIELHYNGASHSGDWLFDPLTEHEREELRWYLEQYWMWPYEGFQDRAEAVELLLEDIGSRLYQALFGRAGAMAIVQPWRLQANADRQISIISDVPAALSLPWELLRDDQGFLALRARNPVSILRRLPQKELPTFSSEFRPPLRILLVTARPEDAGFVDQRVIASELLDELNEQIEAGAIELEFLRPPTFAALTERLSDIDLLPVHILHFDGHGAFGQQTVADNGISFGGRGALAFEDDDGKMHLVSSEELGNALNDSGVRLVVLNACQSAMGSADDVFSSVAARLIKSGVDAVAAMSTSVLVASASRYAEKFYDKLAEGKAVPLAHEHARKALYTNPNRHVHRRESDDEGQPVKLRDWWMPHFYQQRPLELKPTRPRRRRQQQAALLRLSEMPAAPRYGFSGRARELHKLERLLFRRKLVVIHGFGGNGKTSLAREAADWLTRTKLYQRALFVSFEQGGGSTILLSALINHLNVAGDYNPDDVAATMEKLTPVLTQQPTLIIADNLESILPGGEAPLDPAERTKLWAVLHQLREHGAGVVLTTRTLAFGDVQLEPGATVAHLPLGGLAPDDAYALASNILKDLEIDRARAFYAQLRDLLVQLDHHPLAIQLVLPTLKEQPVERISNDFAALLANFKDDNVTGRNRSLLASLDYSLRRLTNEQRALLPRLALFEGGAMEQEILVITEIPETEWAALRTALEQAALIRAEYIHEAISVPFLHFHPTLAPFLRTQPGADDEELKQRYAERYHTLANSMYSADDRNPHSVRALVRRELPNLRRGLALLIAMNELDAAAEMFTCMAWFLDFFGMRRERSDLSKQLDTKLAQRLQSSDELTRAEYLRESERGEAEWSSGEIQSAYSRFTRLLERIEAQLEGTAVARRSYEHCVTLHKLARCLEEGGHSSSAETHLYEAITIIDQLMIQQPENQFYIRQRSALFTSLGDALIDQGKYNKAHKAYDEALKLSLNIKEERGAGIILSRLGDLALVLKNYTEAQKQFYAALLLSQKLNEPASEAVAFHQLGVLKLEQKQWTEAERYCRESLAISERIGDRQGSARSCNQLAIVATNTERPAEAENWYRRALELRRDIGNSKELAETLNNLADLLLNEVRAGRVSQARLAEARSYAEQALKILETLDASSQIWTTLGILASIAVLEGRTEEARAYRSRERETFASFPGKRYHIDQKFARLIVAIAAAAQGNEQARASVESVFPNMEAENWGNVPSVIRKIWAGEREWHALVEGLHREPALLIKRVLETIENPEAAPQIEDEGPDMAAALKEFGPLMQDIANVAQGDETHRAQIEELLPQLEENGWRLTNPVQRIWAGERDAVTLCEGIDPNSAQIIRQILGIIAKV